MKVYALVGKSGSGKSYHAMNVCGDLGIESLIDDGLFVMGNTIVIGVSAKRQKTKIGAIKTALFSDESHRETVKEAIKDAAPQSILIIGTSVEMTDRIAKALELPEIEEYIQIEDITTENERRIAELQREKYGKHVIPVPSFKLKRQFSGYFMNPLRLFKGRDRSESENDGKTVVRPDYSYLGKFTINEKVFSDIAELVAGKSKDISRIAKVFVAKNGGEATLEVTLFIRYGAKVIDAVENFQKELKEQAEKMTSLYISEVNVEIKALED